MTATIKDARFQPYLDDDAELPELRPFPQVASQILSACDAPDTTPKDLAHIIQCDPAVATRLLKVANSSMYGFAGEITSIELAIVAMGFRSVKSMAVSIAAAGVFESKSETVAAESKRLWLHSLATGTISSAVAKHANVKPEDAFLAGVVHDVGKLVFLDLAAASYVEAMTNSCSSLRNVVEINAYGISHQIIGERCADEWGLPGEVNSAIASHHEPEDAYDCEEVASVVCVANCLARYWSLGGAEGSAEELDTALERSSLELTTDSFDDEFKQQTTESFAAICSACT